MLFCQPNRTFSCSRVLLFPCNPIVEVVKHVVKTRTSKKHKWSPQNRSNHQDCGSSRKQKTGREKTRCGQPESSQPKYVVINNRNRVVKPCGRKPLRAGKRTPTSRAFLLPVLYCNSYRCGCQGLKIKFPLPKYLGAINKEKGILGKESLFKFNENEPIFNTESHETTRNSNSWRYKKFNARAICFRKSLAFCRE